MSYAEEFRRWCEDETFDTETRKELLGLTDPKEIEDRFYRTLSFGTGGLRGKIGAGTNRMNFYTVGKATQGLADFLNARERNASVVIAYDSRHKSYEFAVDSARVLAANAIKTYLFESLRPTPELSFAVRTLKASAGIVITASHNPSSYNGYKVYLKDGGQIVPPYDKQIIQAVNAVRDYADVKYVDEKTAIARGLLERIGKDMDDRYIAAIKRLVLSPEALKQCAGDIKIVYTPLHGSGNLPVQRILKELGFRRLFVVPEQEQPNGDFPTVSSPNPENPSAFSLALALAEQKEADVVLATDPDADRLGVYAKDGKGGYIRFTGNMSGLLLAEYELSRKKELGLLPARAKDGAMITTVVSSDMAKAIANEYRITLKETLTGFKYIGEQIRLFEEAKEKNGGKIDSECGAYEYLFGFEESYGCLIGDYARDKDAVAAAMALCEAAAYYRTKNLTLWDQMKRIYEKYGYYQEDLLDRTYQGAEGAEKISGFMKKLRDYPVRLGENRIIAVRDYLCGERYELASKRTTKLSLPESDALYFELENDGWCCVRPSGTEPKIKFYFGVKESSLLGASKRLSALKQDLLLLIDKE